MFCVTRYGASGGRVHFLLRVFDSLLVGCVGVGRLQRQLATWRPFKKVDKANRYGARGGEGANSRQLRARRGDCFSALHITPHRTPLLEEGRESHLVGRRRSISSSSSSSCKEHGEEEGKGRARGEANAGDRSFLPIRCGASAYPAVAAASRRRRLWQLSPGERTPVDALRSVGRQDCCMGARVAQCVIAALLCSFQIHRASQPRVI